MDRLTVTTHAAVASFKPLIPYHWRPNDIPRALPVLNARIGVELGILLARVHIEPAPHRRLPGAGHGHTHGHGHVLSLRPGVGPRHGCAGRLAGAQRTQTKEERATRDCEKRAGARSVNHEVNHEALTVGGRGFTGCKREVCAGKTRPEGGAGSGAQVRLLCTHWPGG